MARRNCGWLTSILRGVVPVNDSLLYTAPLLPALKAKIHYRAMHYSAKCGFAIACRLSVRL